MEEETMKTCRGCRAKFEPKKSFHFLCDDCFPKAARCQTCGKVVIEKDGRWVCCGHDEDADESRSKERVRTLMITDALFPGGPAVDYFDHDVPNEGF